MRVPAVLLLLGACGGSSAEVKAEPAPAPAAARRVEPAMPRPDGPEWRLEASGEREDTMFRVDVVAYAPQARACATWRESAQWTVEAEAEGEPMKRLVCGPARVEETVDTGEVVVRFAVYFEPPAGKTKVDVKVAPPDGKTERTRLMIEEADTWHKVEAAGGPRAFVEGAFAAAGGTLFAVDDKRLLRSTDGGKSWEDVVISGNQAAQSIVATRDGVILATNGGLYASADGLSWRNLVRPIPRRRLLLQAGSRAIVAVADKRAVFCSADGKTWQRPKKGLPPGRILDVAVAGKAVLAAVGHRGRETLFRSADGCKSFRAVGPGATVAAEDELAVAAAGETAYRSSDGGASWHEVPAPGPAGTFHLALVDGKPVAALLDANFPAALLRLDGASWQRVKRGGLPRVKSPPTLLPAGDTLYLVADRRELWSLEARLVR
jgi:photosystem II stability/assembly factor-like uncharacterized protein